MIVIIEWEEEGDWLGCCWIRYEMNENDYDGFDVLVCVIILIWSTRSDWIGFKKMS